MNAAVVSLLGFLADKLCGEVFLDLVHDDDRAQTGHALGQLRDGEAVVPLDCRLRRADGSDIRVVGECLSALNETDLCFGVCRPATGSAPSSMDTALSASERRLSDILDKTPVVVYVKDVQGRYLYVNAKFEQLFDMTRDEIRGHTDFEIFPREIAEAFRSNDIQVARSGETLEIDEIAPHEDGPHTYLSVKFPLRNEQGEIYAVAGISTDVTDRLRHEATQRELKAAQVVQQVLYPQQPPACAGFDVAGRVYPASSMCGDYLDFILQGNDKITIAVGDVSGHGFGPALQMVETRACLRAILRTGHTADEAVTHLNRMLFADTPQESFVTLFLVQIDLPSRTMTYVAAGHVGWLLRAGEEPQQLRSTGLVLGIERDQHYTASEPLQLKSGDVLLLPTDGVQETQNPNKELFNGDRMLKTVHALLNEPACEIVERLYRATVDFAAARQQSDDVTIAVVKVL